jgi:hypothetical protein
MLSDRFLMLRDGELERTCEEAVKSRPSRSSCSAEDCRSWLVDCITCLKGESGGFEDDADSGEDDGEGSVNKGDE